MTEPTGIKILKEKVISSVQKVPQGIWFLFIIWPFAAFVYALRRFRSPWSSKVFIFFAAFFGFTFVTIGDSDRVAALLQTMQGISLRDVFTNYFAVGTGNLDIVYSIITYLVAIFTDDYRFLFAILTFLFAFFIAKSVWFLIQRKGGRIGKLDGLILIAFALMVQIWYIGGRWNLAALVFSYGLLLYFYSDNRKYLLFSFLSVFVHWSFFLVLPVVLLYLLFKNRSLVYYVFFVVSFFFALVSTQSAQSRFEEYAPDPVLKSRSSYFDKNVIKSRTVEAEKSNWYVTGHREAINWFVFVTASFIFLLKKNTIRQSKPLFNLFNFAMLFLALANALSSIPSMSRFFTVGHWLFLAVFFLYMHELKGRFHPAINTFGFAALLLFIIVRIRIGMDYISLWTIIGNPLYVYFIENSTPLIYYIKMLF